MCRILFHRHFGMIITLQFLLFSFSIFSAMYYVKVMKKVLDKGVEYIQTEHERLGRILSQLLLTIETLYRHMLYMTLYY